MFISLKVLGLWGRDSPPPAPSYYFAEADWSHFGRGDHSPSFPGQRPQLSSLCGLLSNSAREAGQYLAPNNNLVFYS